MSHENISELTGVKIDEISSVAFDSSIRDQQSMFKSVEAINMGMVAKNSKVREIM